jgi:chromosome segregation ATPase
MGLEKLSTYAWDLQKENIDLKKTIEIFKNGQNFLETKIDIS